MDFNVKNAIDIRKQSIFDYYDVKDSATLEEIEKFFQEMIDLGESVEGVIDFESQFANSDLNEKYLNLLKKISLTSMLKKQHIENVYTSEDVKEDIKDAAKDELEYLGREAVIDANSAINRKLGITEKIRQTPILGTTLEIKKHAENIMNIKDIFKKKREDKKAKDEVDKDLDKE